MEWVWAFIGAIASAIAAIGVIRQEIRQKRIRANARWKIKNPAALETSPAGMTVMLINEGDLTAREVMILPRECCNPANKMGWIFSSIRDGASVSLEIASANQESWLQIIWRSPHHQDKMLSTWLPLWSDTPLGERQFEQKKQSWGQRLMKPKRLKRDASPDGVLYADLPASPRKQLKVLSQVKKQTEKLQLKQRKPSRSK